MVNMNEYKDAYPETRDQKLQVVGVLYEAMISIAQELRQTIERLTMAGCGVVLLTTGWLLSRQNSIKTSHRYFIAISIIVFTIVAIAITWSIKRRYQGVAQSIRRLNEVQLVHVLGAYVHGKVMFPPHFRDYGSDQWVEPIFTIAYLSWILVGGLAAGAIWIL
jgi:hypothetical protein